MASWQYHRGEWTPIQEQLFEEDINTSLQARGFEGPSTLGVEGTSSLSAEIWEANAETNQWQYVVCAQVTLGRFTVVFVTDFPSMVMFLKEFQPLASHGLLQDLQGVLSSVMSKAFHTWHGHSWENVCKDCDPAQVEQTRRMMSRRENEVIPIDELRDASQDERPEGV